jgi:hypothetical protein
MLIIFNFLKLKRTKIWERKLLNIGEYFLQPAPTLIYTFHILEWGLLYLSGLIIKPREMLNFGLKYPNLV